jgi:predicted PurR-regulated permease PerM
MESWRGVVGWLAAAWRTGADAAGRPANGNHDEKAETRTERSGGDGVIRAESGSRPVMTENGAQPDNERAEEERIARGTGVQDQIARGAAVRELDRTARRPDAADRRTTVPGQSHGARVPGWLQTAAAWSWRLLLLAIVIYLIARLLGVLYIVVLPCVAALLLTALLQPLTAMLRRHGLPPLAATWVTLLITAAVLGGVVMLIANRVSADYPTLLAEAKHTTAQVQSWLAGPPFHVKNSNIQRLLNNIPSYLSKHKALVEGTVVTGGKIASEFFGGLVLMLFVLFFLIKDGERIWNWLLGAMRTDTARRMDRAGHAAWLAVVYYMRGTVAVAAIHGLVIGLALWIMGVPLALPLAVLVFLAAFVPLVGLLVAGAAAILVTLATKGWVDAVILLVILIIEDQLEAHLLQPQVVGRVIRLHPLAVILSLAVGAVLAGIPGAVVAVPVVAVITRALPELRRSEPDDPDIDGGFGREK